MPGKRVQLDEESWAALDLLARDRMLTACLRTGRRPLAQPMAARHQREHQRAAAQRCVFSDERHLLN